ncbi:MAG: ATP-binding protein, partial [Planctomycetes bacterium]|nr:ATP-binding protein [Planctomycetota bacterium]
MLNYYTNQTKDIETVKQQLPLHNLGLYRLKGFVGRAEELKQLSSWFGRYPVVAITGPSGAGKSTLATALAVQEAHKFEQGILWIGATGDETFNFYDIVRAIEDILATGITNQMVSAWPLIVLQQLYGANRLLILDELTEADADTVDKIIDMIG